MHDTGTVSVSTDLLRSWTDVLGSCLTGADLVVNVDLRDLDQSPIDCLRILLIADVLRRVVEEIVGAQATPVIMRQCVQLPGPLEHLPTTLRILPVTTRRTPSTQKHESSCPPVRVTLISTERSRHVAPGIGETLLPVGDVMPRGVEHDLVRWLVSRDPLTARLALLRFIPSVPAILSLARLHRASETLDRWRFKVAGWKNAPPAPAFQLTALQGLLVNGCDTASVLRLLHRIETDHVIPSGAKYQIFVDLDRILGLDLTRRQFGPNIW